MIRIKEYDTREAKFTTQPSEKEFSCLQCSKPVSFRWKSPYYCPGCLCPMVDASGLMENKETRITYHKSGEVSIIHGKIYNG